MGGRPRRLPSLRREADREPDRRRLRRAGQRVGRGRGRARERLPGDRPRPHRRRPEARAGRHRPPDRRRADAAHRRRGRHGQRRAGAGGCPPREGRPRRRRARGRACPGGGGDRRARRHRLRHARSLGDTRRAGRRRQHLLRRPAGRVGRPSGADQGGPREGRADRLPDRRPDPPDRLRVARRSVASAGSRRLRRAGHRRADLRDLATDGDVGLRHQHGVDDRDRRRRRLLPVHPRPLPGSSSPRRPGRGGARRGALDLGPRGHLLGPRRDHLPGRPLDGRQPGAALDGARGDGRRRRRDPGRDHAAAGADPEPGPPRRGRRSHLERPQLLPRARPPQAPPRFDEP